MWIVWVAFALVVGILSGASSANAQKRVALVIGNGAYSKVPRLDNPKNDAATMEAVFRAAGFDTVVRANDLGVAAMRRTLRDFSDTAQDVDVAVIFYAGHGIEVAGVNYLIPTDAVLQRDIDAQDEAISLDRLNQILEPVKRLRLVILDACRDNPFARSMRRTIATRSVRSGYGEIDERSLPPNTLVAYAQRAGATAEDGVGSKNSPYTAALAKHLPTPGLDVELALRRVRDEVLRATNNRQEPFKYGLLGGAELPLVPAPTKQVETGAAKQSSAAGEVVMIIPSRVAALLQGGAVSELFTDAARDHVVALAAKKELPLPEFTIQNPDGDVPTNVRSFVGIWVSDPGWGSGRQGMLIIVNGDQQGQVAGFDVRGPPKPTSFIKEPAAHNSFVGTISGDLLTIPYTKSTWRVRLRKDRVDITETFKDGPESVASYKRVWNLVEAERAGKAAEETIAAKWDAVKTKEPEKIAALPKLEKPPASEPFDGAWMISWTGGPSGCDVPSGTYTIRVANGTILGKTSTGVPWSGSISTKGSARWSSSNTWGALSYSGKFAGSSGSGSFVNNKCHGTFSAKRVRG